MESFTITWSTLLLYVLLFNYTISDAVKDGLIDRGQTPSGRVGWKQFHYVAWRTRWPTQAAIGSLIVLGYDHLLWQIWHVCAVLIVCSLHEPAYQWTIRNRDHFTGDESKYGWWIVAKKIMEKLFPWV